jgi:hypothetical protein
MSEPKPMEIVRQFNGYFCIKSRRKYYCVFHDAKTGTTTGIISSDKVAGEFRSTMGWTREAIELVARPHKRKTAIFYFNAFLRDIKRKKTAIAAVVDDPPEVEDDLEESDKICSWCNGSGQDPRNIEWSCTRC